MTLEEAQKVAEAISKAGKITDVRGDSYGNLDYIAQYLHDQFPEFSWESVGAGDDAEIIAYSKENDKEES